MKSSNDEPTKLEMISRKEHQILIMAMQQKMESKLREMMDIFQDWEKEIRYEVDLLRRRSIGTYPKIRYFKLRYHFIDSGHDDYYIYYQIKDSKEEEIWFEEFNSMKRKLKKLSHIKNPLVNECLLGNEVPQRFKNKMTMTIIELRTFLSCRCCLNNEFEEYEGQIFLHCRCSEISYESPPPPVRGRNLNIKANIRCVNLSPYPNENDHNNLYRTDSGIILSIKDGISTIIGSDFENDRMIGFLTGQLCLQLRIWGILIDQRWRNTLPGIGSDLLKLREIRPVSWEVYQKTSC